MNVIRSAPIGVIRSLRRCLSRVIYFEKITCSLIEVYLLLKTLRIRTVLEIGIHIMISFIKVLYNKCVIVDLDRPFLTLQTVINPRD